jgi:hypothetical protein
MPVQASDLKFYASEHMPENNTSLSGGDINTSVRVVFSDIVNVDTIDVFSTNNTLNGTLTVIGQDANNDPIQENFTLAGTTTVAGTSLFKNIWRMYYLDAAHTGSIYIQDDSTSTVIGVLEDYVTGIVRVFHNTIADYYGGNSYVYYEKVFVKNTHASSTLLGVEVSEQQLGLYDVISLGVEDSFRADQSVANRLTAPTGVSSYGAGPTPTVEGPHLLPGIYQGIWLKLESEPGDPTANSFYGLRVTGRSS